MEDKVSGEGRSRGASGSLAGIAAVGSVLAASSCCLPVFPFLLAAGAAGGSAFFAAARPYLLAVSVLLIAWAFYQARRAKRCARKPGVISSVVLWSSAVFVAVAIFFPQVMADAGASLLGR